MYAPSGRIIVTMTTNGWYACPCFALIVYLLSNGRDKWPIWSAGLQDFEWQHRATLNLWCVFFPHVVCLKVWFCDGSCNVVVVDSWSNTGKQFYSRIWSEYNKIQNTLRYDIAFMKKKPKGQVNSVVLHLFRPISLLHFRSLAGHIKKTKLFLFFVHHSCTCSLHAYTLITHGS